MARRRLQRWHRLFRTLCVLGSLGALVVGASSAWSHRLKQARVFHLLVHGQEIEVYVNLLMPRNAKTMLWVRLFDRDRSGRLDPKERVRLGRYLQKRYLHGISLRVNERPLKLALKEVRNSKLRGNPRLHRYSWDYRMQARAVGLRGGRNVLKMKVPLLFQREQVPVAWVVQGGDRIERSKTSVPLRKGTRATCRIHRGQHRCVLFLRRPAKPTPASRPTQTP